MDLEHSDEFGIYIDPDLLSSDWEGSGGEPEPSEMPLVHTGVVEEGTEEVEKFSEKNAIFISEIADHPGRRRQRNGSVEFN